MTDNGKDGCPPRKREGCGGELSTEELAENWERRGQSNSRDFYISSHPGWDNEAKWNVQAGHDVKTILHGLEPAALSAMDLLEIGCGVGRLTPFLSGQMRSYTGFDIAPSMISEAVRRHSGLPGVRFFVSDGESMPEGVRDRQYDLILAFAVLIHCPQKVIEATIRSAIPLLKPGGQLRFQVRADPSNLDGIVSLESAQQVHEQMIEIEESITDVQATLLGEDDYMGHMFSYGELQSWLETISGGDAFIVRVDLASIYGWITIPDQ